MSHKWKKAGRPSDGHEDKDLSKVPVEKFEEIVSLLKSGNLAAASTLADLLAIKYKLTKYEVILLVEKLKERAGLPARSSRRKSSPFTVRESDNGFAVVGPLGDVQEFTGESEAIGVADAMNGGVTAPDWENVDKGALQDAGRWLAEKWQSLEGRYGRKGALAMAVAMLATLPIPGNVAAIVAAAEAIRGVSGKELAMGKMLRKKLAKGRPTSAFDDDARTIDWVMTTETEDRDGETVDPEGGNFDDFLKNPTVAFNHDTDDFPIGKLKGEPWNDYVGEGTKYADVGGPKRLALLGKVFFSKENPKGDLAYRMAKEGTLGGGSISFLPDGDVSKNDGGGNHYGKWKLLEFTICPVGSNPDAVKLTKRLKNTASPADPEFVEENKKMDSGQLNSQQLSMVAEMEADGSEVLYSNLRNNPRYSIRPPGGSSFGDSLSTSLESLYRWWKNHTSKSFRRMKGLGVEKGQVKVEDLRQGDLIRTRESGNAWMRVINVYGGPSFFDLKLGEAFTSTGEPSPNPWHHEELRFTRGEIFERKTIMNRKLWIKNKTAWVLKNEGPIDDELREELSAKGVDEIMERDGAPADPEFVEEKAAEKSKGRKFWHKGNKAILLKADGPVDDEMKQYLEERGLDDIQVEEAEPEDAAYKMEEMEEKIDSDFKVGDKVSVKLPHGNEDGAIVAVQGDSVKVLFDDGQSLVIYASFVSHKNQRKSGENVRRGWDIYDSKGRYQGVYTGTYMEAYHEAVLEFGQGVRIIPRDEDKGKNKKSMHRKGFKAGYKALQKWIKAIEDDVVELEQPQVLDAAERALKVLKGAMGKAYGDVVEEQAHEDEEMEVEKIEDEENEKQGGMTFRRSGQIYQVTRTGQGYVVYDDDRIQVGGPFESVTQAVDWLKRTKTKDFQPGQEYEIEVDYKDSDGKFQVGQFTLDRSGIKLDSGKDFRSDPSAKQSAGAVVQGMKQSPKHGRVGEVEWFGKISADWNIAASLKNKRMTKKDAAAVTEAADFLEDAALAGDTPKRLAIGMRHLSASLKQLMAIPEEEGMDDEEELSIEDEQRLEMAIKSLEASGTRIGESWYRATGRRA